MIETKTNRINHCSPMQTENPNPAGGGGGGGGKRILLETRFTEFPELSGDPRVGISRSETDD